MPNRSLTLAGCFAAALCACGKPTEVELRLVPCALTAGEPMRVDLEIQGYDDAGQPTGARLAETFAIADASVFDDGYATVGFRPPAGAVKADFTVRWTAADEVAVVTLTGLPVPALGEALELGAEGCSDVGETSTGTTTGDTSTTDPSSTTTADTSTGEPPDTSTGDPSTSTTDVTTTTGETTEATSTGGDTTGGGPMEGLPCDDPEGHLECDGGAGVLGTLLRCSGGVWELVDLTDICDLQDACGGLDLTAPKVTGCLGDGDAWSCACADAEPTPCEGASACGPMVGDLVQVEICVADDMAGTVRHRGLCSACEDTSEGALCVMI